MIFFRKLIKLITLTMMTMNTMIAVMLVLNGARGEESIIRAQQELEAAGHRVSKTDTNVIYHTCHRSLGALLVSRGT